MKNILDKNQYKLYKLIYDRFLASQMSEAKYNNVAIDIDSQGAKEWAPKLKALKKGECVTCGNMVKNDKWTKYSPRIIKVTSLQERLNND